MPTTSCKWSAVGGPWVPAFAVEAPSTSHGFVISLRALPGREGHWPTYGNPRKCGGGRINKLCASGKGNLLICPTTLNGLAMVARCTTAMICVYMMIVLPLG